MKRCSQCRETKPMDAFYNDRSTADGRARACKNCYAKYREQPDVQAATRAYQRSYQARYRRRPSVARKRGRGCYDSMLPGPELPGLTIDAESMAMRDELIVEAAFAGYSNAQIGTAAGVSERRISQIIKRYLALNPPELTEIRGD